MKGKIGINLLLGVNLTLNGTSGFAQAPTQQTSPTVAERHLVEFNAPGATTVVSAICGSFCGTQALANNDEGTVVGYYTDEYVVPHAFIRWRDGHFSSFDAPNAGLGHYLNEGTGAYSINDFGVIAGQYEDANEFYHGFIRYPDGEFTIIDAPDAGEVANAGTLAYSINLEGDTAGVYYDSNYQEHGFVRFLSGDLVEFDPSGSVSTMVCEETCVSPEGTVVGFYADSTSTIHGFLRSRDGVITSFDAPGAGTGNYTGTIAASISAEGEIAGYLVDDQGLAHGFVRHRDGSFGKSFEVKAAALGPGQGTAPFSVSDFGAVTGIFVDANNADHGFVRTADERVTTFSAPDAGSAAYQGTRPSTNNIEGEVTGWYVDSTNLLHGFVWLP